MTETNASDTVCEHQAQQVEGSEEYERQEQVSEHILHNDYTSVRTYYTTRYDIRRRVLDRNSTLGLDKSEIPEREKRSLL